MTIPNCAVSSVIPSQDQRLSSYKRHGFCFVPRLLPKDLVQELAIALDHHVQHQLSKRADITYHGTKTTGPRFIMDYCNYHDIIAYQKVAQFVAPMAAKLLQSQTVRVYQDQLIVKEPHTESATTIWHSDLPYFDLQGTQAINCWIPVDHVDRPSSLECVAGSHLQGPYIPRSYKTNQQLFDVPNGVDIPPINEDRTKYDIHGWEFTPGDVLFHSLECLHGAATGSTRGRRVLALRLIGDDMVPKQCNHFVVSSLANKDFEGRDFPLVYDATKDQSSTNDNE